MRRIYAWNSKRGGSLSGRILDPDGSPLPNARIHLGACGEGKQSVVFQVDTRSCLLSDATGCYRLDGLPASSSYSVVACEELALGMVCGIQVEPGIAVQGVDVRLERGRGAIRGRVTTADGSGIPGMGVTARPKALQAVSEDCFFGWAGAEQQIRRDRKGRTDGGGRYEIADLHRGSTSWAPEGVEIRAWERNTVDVPDGQAVVGVDFIADAPGVETLSGRVTDTEGRPVPGAFVQAGKLPQSLT